MKVTQPAWEIKRAALSQADSRDDLAAMSSRCAARFLAAFCVALMVQGCSIPRWPVDGTMTSPYGLRLRGIRPDIHEGVDIAAETGTPVHAMKSGRVEHAGAWGGYGLSIVIAHGSNVRSLYAHLSRIDVTAGQRVDGGAVIGAVGQTGSATGPHLHFEVWRWGRAEDPVVLLGGYPPGR